MTQASNPTQDWLSKQNAFRRAYGDPEKGVSVEPIDMDTIGVGSQEIHQKNTNFIEDQLLRMTNAAQTEMPDSDMWETMRDMRGMTPALAMEQVKNIDVQLEVGHANQDDVQYSNDKQAAEWARQQRVKRKWYQQMADKLQEFEPHRKHYNLRGTEGMTNVKEEKEQFNTGFTRPSGEQNVWGEYKKAPVYTPGEGVSYNPTKLSRDLDKAREKVLLEHGEAGLVEWDQMSAVSPGTGDTGVDKRPLRPVPQMREVDQKISRTRTSGGWHNLSRSGPQHETHYFVPNPNYKAESAAARAEYKGAMGRYLLQHGFVEAQKKALLVGDLKKAKKFDLLLRAAIHFQPTGFDGTAPDDKINDIVGMVGADKLQGMADNMFNQWKHKENIKESDKNMAIMEMSDGEIREHMVKRAAFTFAQTFGEMYAFAGEGIDQAMQHYFGTEDSFDRDTSPGVQFLTAGGLIDREQEKLNKSGIAGNFWNDQLPEIVGAQLGFSAVGGVAGWLTKGMKYSRALQLGAIGVAGGGMSFKSMRADAIAHGATNSEADKMVWWAALAGSTEAIPFAVKIKPLGRMANALNKLSSKTQSRMVAALTKAGAIVSKEVPGETIEEAIQEAIQQGLHNWGAQELYDFNRELMEGVAESAALGAVFGGGMKFITGIYGGVKAAAMERIVGDDAEIMERLLAEHGLQASDMAAEAETPTSSTTGSAETPTGTTAEEKLAHHEALMERGEGGPYAEQLLAYYKQDVANERATAGGSAGTASGTRATEEIETELEQDEQHLALAKSEVKVRSAEEQVQHDAMVGMLEQRIAANKQALQGATSTTSATTGATEAPATGSGTMADPVAANFLTEGGFGGIIGTDYLMRGMAGLFPNAASKIHSIREKYTNELERLGLVDAKDFKGSDLHTKMFAEIKAELVSLYGESTTLNSVMETLYKYSEGMTPKIGTPLQAQIDSLLAAAAPTSTSSTSETATTTAGAQASQNQADAAAKKQSEQSTYDVAKEAGEAMAKGDLIEPDKPLEAGDKVVVTQKNGETLDAKFIARNSDGKQFFVDYGGGQYEWLPIDKVMPARPKKLVDAESGRPVTIVSRVDDKVAVHYGNNDVAWLDKAEADKRLVTVGDWNEQRRTTVQSDRLAASNESYEDLLGKAKEQNKADEQADEQAAEHQEQAEAIAKQQAAAEARRSEQELQKKLEPFKEEIAATITANLEGSSVETLKDDNGNDVQVVTLANGNKFRVEYGSETHANEQLQEDIRTGSAAVLRNIAHSTFSESPLEHAAVLRSIDNGELDQVRAVLGGMDLSVGGKFDNNAAPVRLVAEDGTEVMVDNAMMVYAPEGLAANEESHSSTRHEVGHALVRLVADAKELALIEKIYGPLTDGFNEEKFADDFAIYRKNPPKRKNAIHRLFDKIMRLVESFVGLKPGGRTARKLMDELASARRTQSPAADEAWADRHRERTVEEARRMVEEDDLQDMVRSNIRRTKLPASLRSSADSVSINGKSIDIWEMEPGDKKSNKRSNNHHQVYDLADEVFEGIGGQSKGGRSRVNGIMDSFGKFYLWDGNQASVEEMRQGLALSPDGSNEIGSFYVDFRDNVAKGSRLTEGSGDPGAGQFTMADIIRQMPKIGLSQATASNESYQIESDVDTGRRGPLNNFRGTRKAVVWARKFGDDGPSDKDIKVAIKRGDISQADADSLSNDDPIESKYNIRRVPARPIDLSLIHI
jgi:hypothetical protein